VNWHDNFDDTLELEVELNTGDDSLQRLLVALHRRRAAVRKLRFDAGAHRDLVRVRLAVPAGRTRLLLASLRREVFVVGVREVREHRYGARR
jgi:hypothetical protein